MDRIERIQVKIAQERTHTPDEFWIKLLPPNDNLNGRENSRAQKSLRLARDRSVFKCHLAFLIPIDMNSWSLAAIEKFNSYLERFGEFSISVPYVVGSTSKSTAVILWGLYAPRENTTDTMDALEPIYYAWQNISQRMVFQGLARSTVYIDYFNSVPSISIRIPDSEHTIAPASATQNKPSDGHDLNDSTRAHKKGKLSFGWLPAELPTNRKFTGVPNFIDDNLNIYVHDSEHRECVDHMVTKLTEWHKKHTKYPSKRWKKGDYCTAICNDGFCRRAEIIEIKNQTSLVNLVDEGRIESIPLKSLSLHSKFKNVPAQLIKCQLQNMIHILDERLADAKNFAHNIIYGQNCSFYIHDNIDPLHPDAIPCSVRLQVSKCDFGTLLVLNGYAEYRSPIDLAGQAEKLKQIADRKRIRTELDKAVLVDSSELKAPEDFQQFYESRKIVTDDSTYVNDDDERYFETFEPPSKKDPFIEKQPLDQIKFDWIRNEPNEIVDCITKHFKLSQMPFPENERKFKCRPLYIIDPVTVLVEPTNATIPLIDAVETLHKYRPFKVHSACIAKVDDKWYRGIVWEKPSTNRYRILFADTLQIDEIRRTHIQQCPVEWLQSKLQLIKVRLSKIKPNERFRNGDICYELGNVILNKHFIAKCVGIHFDGIPDVKLTQKEESKRGIYENLIRKNFYKKIR